MMAPCRVAETVLVLHAPLRTPLIIMGIVTMTHQHNTHRKRFVQSTAPENKGWEGEWGGGGENEASPCKVFNQHPVFSGADQVTSQCSARTL